MPGRFFAMTSHTPRSLRVEVIIVVKVGLLIFIMKKEGFFYNACVAHSWKGHRGDVAIPHV